LSRSTVEVGTLTTVTKNPDTVRYTSMLAQVRAVINRHDPEGLLELECPEDEYNPEVRDFARLLCDGQLITQQVVIGIWKGGSAQTAGT
jgi:hypothetical protein